MFKHQFMSKCTPYFYSWFMIMKHQIWFIHVVELWTACSDCSRHRGDHERNQRTRRSGNLFCWFEWKFIYKYMQLNNVWHAVYTEKAEIWQGIRIYFFTMFFNEIIKSQNIFLYISFSIVTFETMKLNHHQ